jgi:microcin C transport system substrate-binding protein
VKDGVLTNAAGTQLTRSSCSCSPTFERIVLPYKNILEQLGIKATVRTVDTSQYQRRHDTFDFDIIVASFGQSLSPATSSATSGARRPAKEGSRNLIGIKRPASTC